MEIRTSVRFEGYSATSDGTIYSHRRKGVKLRGTRGGTKSMVDYNFWKEVNGYVNAKGYIIVGVVDKGIYRPAGAHQIVADAFHGLCPNGMQVRHLDGNPKNNHVSNLKYGTIFENNQDRKRHGTYYSGGEHPSSKLSDMEAKEIRRLRSLKVKVKELAVQFKVSVPVIEAIIYNKAYKNAI